MTSAPEPTLPGIPTAIADPQPTAALRATDMASAPRRLAALIARTMWLHDRGLAELRWAAVTLAAIGGLALVAKLVDPSDRAFDLALTLALPTAAIAVLAGWSSAGLRPRQDRARSESETPVFGGRRHCAESVGRDEPAE
ncbi:hypothetical protein BH20CHL7_BH20CHL7_15160 [soil metagenome]